MTDRPLCEISWGLAGHTGWGLVGLHMALGLQRRGWDVRTTFGPGAQSTVSPPLVAALSRPDPARVPDVQIDAWGDWGERLPTLPPSTAKRRAVFAVFSDTLLSPVVLDALRTYDLVLAPSTWCQGILAAHGVASTLWHQGYDDALFTPAPKRRSSERLFVFSGGKLEFRKGQDIVVEAFRRFLRTPEGKDAVLVTAWQNLWPDTMESIDASGYVTGRPALASNRRLDIIEWLERNGIPRTNAIDLGWLTQAQTAEAMRESDVAVFPNRNEGATNMTLCEVIGCGLPVIGSHATGQRDVAFDRVAASPDRSVPPCPLYHGTDGWFEADPDAIVAALSLHVQYPVAPDVRSHASRFGWFAASARLDGHLRGAL